MQRNSMRYTVIAILIALFVWVAIRTLFVEDYHVGGTVRTTEQAIALAEARCVGLSESSDWRAHLSGDVWTISLMKWHGYQIWKQPDELAWVSINAKTGKVGSCRKTVR